MWNENEYVELMSVAIAAEVKRSARRTHVKPLAMTMGMLSTVIAGTLMTGMPRGDRTLKVDSKRCRNNVAMRADESSPRDM